MATSNIKTCPFCGTNCEIEEWYCGDSPTALYRVKCVSEDWHCLDSWNEDKEESIKEWNLREDNWIKITDINKLPPVTPMLVYGECCNITYTLIVAELEDNKWFISDSGEELDFKPSHYQLIELPKTK